MSDHLVRTFAPRRRQLTPARAALFERLASVWCIDDRGPTLDPEVVFGRVAPLVLEIGMGIGDTTAAVAIAEPEIDVIAVDVHTPGIVATLARIESSGLTNLRLVHGDALRFLSRVAPDALAGVRIYFPDPWPKVRHHHRRIVRDDVVEQLVERLRPGGWIHVATDIEGYSNQIQVVCERHGNLVGGVVGRPKSRPITRYERKGIEAGRSATDLRYVKSNVEPNVESLPARPV